MTVNRYPVITREIFNQVIKSDRGIHEMRWHHGYCDNNCNLLGQISYIPKMAGVEISGWCDINEELQAEAVKLYDARKAELIQEATEVGTLMFVGMGMDFAPTFKDQIGNHRICAIFEDKKGHKWFMEINPGKDQGFWGSIVDVTKNEEEQARFDRENEVLIAMYGSAKDVPNYKWAERHWPEYHHRRIESGEFKYTYSDVRKFVNKELKCNYKKVKLASYCLGLDDYIGKCKA